MGRPDATLAAPLYPARWRCEARTRAAKQGGAAARRSGAGHVSHATRAAAGTREDVRERGTRRRPSHAALRNSLCDFVRGTWRTHRVA
ncbi:hypothetical protein WS64_21945 [Burkholderia anthina]|uniref:Uncharacterized protein n=1 Tax=Burkholderia anthina TaxID=179879 RepID=A0AAW3PRK6_9BURK|nr:hypothetical protein WS64_21945 [Burkholderia anthina]